MFENKKAIAIQKEKFNIERELIEMEYQMNKYKIIAQEYCPHLQSVVINEGGYGGFVSGVGMVNHPPRSYNECLCCGKQTKIEKVNK